MLRVMEWESPGRAFCLATMSSSCSDMEKSKESDVLKGNGAIFSLIYLLLLVFIFKELKVNNLYWNT